MTEKYMSMEDQVRERVEAEEKSLDEMRRRVEERREKGPPGHEPGEKKRGGNGGGEASIDSKFVTDCLYAEELGDGVLFATVHKGKFLFNKSSAEWLRYAGHNWEVDLMNQATASVETVAQAYGSEGFNMSGKIKWAEKKGDEEAKEGFEDLRKRFFKRMSKLRTEHGRRNCLAFAHTNPTNALQVSGDDLDRDPWLLACKNGVINLRTGELQPGRPEDLLVRASPIDWVDIEALAPTWDKTLKSIFEDREMIEYLQRLFGYAATGLTVEPILPVLIGQGRNGKTTIVEAIGQVLGPLAGPIPSELLLASNYSKSPDSPTPSMVDLRGLRIAFASEVEENRRFSSSRVKWLSGSDSLIGRAPHDKRSTRFKPSHTLVLMTNHHPGAPMDDLAFWERIHLIPFEFSFVNRPPKADHEKPADKHLAEKLLAEASGILAWLVRGCLRWQEYGINPPEKVCAATEEYRRSEDLLADFLEECCHVDPEASAGASELYDAFKEWWTDNVSKKVLSQNKFGRLMGRRNFKKRKTGGIYKYGGLRLLN